MAGDIAARRLHPPACRLNPHDFKGEGAEYEYGAVVLNNKQAATAAVKAQNAQCK